MKVTTWSDDECTEETHDEDEKMSGNFVVFTIAITEPQPELESDSDHDEVDKLPYEELEKSYIQLYKKWEIFLKTHTKINAKNGVLEKNIEILRKQLAYKDAELVTSDPKVV